jgi:glucan phosphoethanolaminetransferase (alkaline phosphatase superfamily)
MLQRIQTIFLALTIIGMGIFVSFPVWTKIAAGGDQQASLTALELKHQLNAVQSNIDSVPYLLILAIIIAGVAAFSIIKFRNRILQSALCAVNSILMSTLLGLVIYLTFYKAAKLFDPQTPGDYTIGFYGLVASMLANVMANRYIRKDEKTVQQSNRLR